MKEYVSYGESVFLTNNTYYVIQHIATYYVIQHIATYYVIQHIATYYVESHVYVFTIASMRGGGTALPICTTCCFQLPDT